MTRSKSSNPLRNPDHEPPQMKKTPIGAAVPSNKTRLLSGGNPQIDKGYGDAQVQKYIDAMPGWKRNVGKKIDELIVKVVPAVEKAIKWNSAFYGREKGSWFIGFHCLTKYVKIAFFHGVELNPPPPGTSRQKGVRYLDIYEGEKIDPVLFSKWVKQASKLPGKRI